MFPEARWYCTRQDVKPDMRIQLTSTKTDIYTDIMNKMVPLFLLNLWFVIRGYLSIKAIFILTCVGFIIIKLTVNKYF